MEPIDCAIEAAKRAGIHLLNHFRDEHTKKMKSRLEVVSEQDEVAEKIILDYIKKHFPNHSILSEESGKDENNSEFMWVVDPLDGTRNYLMGNPLFSVSISLVKNSVPILGVVYAPYTDEMFHAEIGKGAYYNEKKIQSSTVDTLEKSLLFFCHGHTTDAMQKAIHYYGKIKPICGEMRQLGSAALEVSFVAIGRAESLFIPGVHAWDVAAATVILLEAGGKVTDFKGNNWTIDSKDFLASNGRIHEKVLEVLQ